jgi:hypothetical protein
MIIRIISFHIPSESTLSRKILIKIFERFLRVERLFQRGNPLDCLPFNQSGFS